MTLTLIRTTTLLNRSLQAKVYIRKNAKDITYRARAVSHNGSFLVMENAFMTGHNLRRVVFASEIALALWVSLEAAPMSVSRGQCTAN